MSEEAENIAKEKKIKRKSLFSVIDGSLKMQNLFEDGIPTQFLPHVLYICMLGVVYIGHSHYASRIQRDLKRLETEVDNLRADYTTTKAELSNNIKYSSVLAVVDTLGLREGKRPPHKIVVENEEH